MSIELNKMAAEFNRYFTSSNGVDVPAKVSVSRDEWRALFTAIQQTEAKTNEPVAWISKTGHGTYFRQSITPELSSLEHGGNKMWRPLVYGDTHPAPGVPDGYVLVRGLVEHIERNTCTHEETHRGGAIWEVCDSCGARWADDEGGKPTFKWPPIVEKARAALAAAQAQKGQQ